MKERDFLLVLNEQLDLELFLIDVTVETAPGPRAQRLQNQYFVRARSGDVATREAIDQALADLQRSSGQKTMPTSVKAVRVNNPAALAMQMLGKRPKKK